MLTVIELILSLRCSTQILTQTTLFSFTLKKFSKGSVIILIGKMEKLKYVVSKKFTNVSQLGTGGHH